MQNFTLMQDNDLRNDFKLVTAEIREKINTTHYALSFQENSLF